MNLMPLFLVSLAAVGYETALTRYFAVAKWSEYGYWVISIVMVGFALSGVVIALWRDAFARNGERLLAILPPILVATAAAGYFLVTVNPFNPLQLQNPATYEPQLWNIGLYYLALLPFFFLTGTFIGLNFVLHARRIGIVYGFDLTGAGAGAASVLVAMFAVHAFNLVPLLLVPLAASALFVDRRWRLKSVLASVLVLLAAEAGLLTDPQAAFNDFKAIYPPLHTQDATVVAQVLSPRGDYLLLDDFQERVDTDISNNAGMMGLTGPPRTYGLYRDGNRIAALPKGDSWDVGYANAALDALPYTLIPGARVLLAGGSGGFRVREVLALGASKVRVLEPEPILADALRHGMGPSPRLPIDPVVRVAGEGPLAAPPGVHDIVDISADFLDSAEANVSAFTAEAIAGYLTAMPDRGIVSIPASIRDFPIYALRMLATARAGLLQAGVQDPAAHVVVYRSAWAVRILLSRAPWSPARIAAIRKFCDDRSFDVSWYPGMNVEAARTNLYNDLPRVSFALGEVEATGPDDAIADEAQAVLNGQPTQSSAFFNLAPITLDRPFYYAAPRLDRIGTMLKRLEILPQQEVGVLVNLAVLAQALVIAAIVLLVPLAARRRLRGDSEEPLPLLRAVVYFPALGLGFLFVEIFLIEKASLWLNDRTSGFALVLTGMLVFSGLGSMAAGPLSRAPAANMVFVAGGVLIWMVAMLFFLQPLILATLSWSWIARATALMAVVAPVSVLLGLPFPLGLSRAGTGGLLPWAWGLNGAFSVVATPLANLIAREAGFERVLLCAAILYGVALLTFPMTRRRPAWHRSTQISPAAD
jgi:hypothetical protein